MWNANPGVRNANRDFRIRCLHFKRNTASSGVFDCVVHQIADDAFELLAVRPNRCIAIIDKCKYNPFCSAIGAKRRSSWRRIGASGTFSMQLRSCADLGEIEQLGHEVRRRQRVLADHFDALHLGGLMHPQR